MFKTNAFSSDSDDDSAAHGYNPNSSGETIRKITSSVHKIMDQYKNSPGLSRNLLDSDNDSTPVKKKKKKKKAKKHEKEDADDSNKEPGSILRKGIKFSSEADFMKFLGRSAKKKESKKRKPQDNGDEMSTVSAAKKPKLESKFNVDKIREVLKSSSSKVSEKKEESVKVKVDHMAKLKSAQFRHLNEKLYTQTGAQSLKMFKQDPDSFRSYHAGFMEQAQKWPVDPLNLIINAIMKVNGSPVVADFGCGEARLARALAGSATVHSFDLVKVNDLVTVCDFSNTPLENESCDIVVFCLSLMGTNLRDFLKEANRVLKIG